MLVQLISHTAEPEKTIERPGPQNQRSAGWGRFNFGVVRL